jgi:hypothetical protein
MVEEISGRAKGGMARMAALPKRERRALGRKAADARWSDEIKQATHGSPDHPLKIGDIEIPCYVLEDGQRVIMQGGMMTALDMKQGTAGRGGGDRLAKFIATKSVSPFVSSELVKVITSPIRFRVGASLAYGYEATILADICDAVLKAREGGELNYQQEHIAQRCEVLVRAFARVGIIALVDEATGYQRDRAKDALARILEAFIAKELQPYVRTFPADFYQEIFRLRGMQYPTATVQRPRYFGLLTNDIVYNRLAPGVLDELKKVNPKDEATGRRKWKHFRWLTKNTGYPKLREHLGAVVATMKLSTDWYDFKAKIDKFYPRLGKPTQLSFDYAREEIHDTGKGL